MKRISIKIFICIYIISLLMSFVGCGGSEDNSSTNSSLDSNVSSNVSSDSISNSSQDSSLSSESNSDSNSSSETATCEHNYVEKEVVQPMALKDGKRKSVCSICSAEQTETLPATKSIKILALGNSFTIDSMQHLWNICKSAGVEEIVLGNLFISGCTLDTHWSKIESNAKSYVFYKNTNGSWTSTKKYTVLKAIQQEDWDVFVFHQNGSGGGFADSYSHLDDIMDFFDKNKTNPNAKMYWNVGWAYQSDSTHGTFKLYDNDQMKMYNMTVSAVQEVIVPNKRFAGIIPSGTAIQNLRTTYLGDTITRDGYHMNYDFGRYQLGLVWCSVLTGGDIDAVDYIPSQYPDVKELLPLLKESAKSAIAEPFKITDSVSYATKPTP